MNVSNIARKICSKHAMDGEPGYDLRSLHSGRRLHHEAGRGALELISEPAEAIRGCRAVVAASCEPSRRLPVSRLRVGAAGANVQGESSGRPVLCLVVGGVDAARPRPTTATRVSGPVRTCLGQRLAPPLSGLLSSVRKGLRLPHRSRRRLSNRARFCWRRTMRQPKGRGEAPPEAGHSVLVANNGREAVALASLQRVWAAL